MDEYPFVHFSFDIRFVELFLPETKSDTADYRKPMSRLVPDIFRNRKRRFTPAYNILPTRIPRY